MLKTILGVIMVGLSLQSSPTFAPLLFVQGIIFVNLGIMGMGKTRGLDRL